MSQLAPGAASLLPSWLERQYLRLSGGACRPHSSFIERTTSMEMSPTKLIQRQAGIILTYVIAKLSLLEISFLDSDRKCLGLQPSVLHRSLASGFLLSIGESHVLRALSGSFFLSLLYSVIESASDLYLTWFQAPGLAWGT